MAMGLFIAPNRKFGNMRAHDIAGEIEVDMSSAGAAFIPYLERHVLVFGTKFTDILSPQTCPLLLK